jgi:Helix-turn-helix domain
MTVATTVIIIQGISFAKPYLRIDEIVERFPLSRTKVYDLIRDGVFTAHCASGAKMKGISIPTVEVKAYFEKIKVPADKWKE